MRILLIEDDTEAASYICKGLTESGHTVDWAENGDDGLHMALTRAGVTRVLLASLAIGVVAALAPAWQVARLDPAQVFRG